LQGSDAIDSVTLTTNATLSGSNNWNAGNWTITASAATGTNFNAGNYNITFASGNLTVNQASLTVSGITASNKVYDGTTAATLDVSAAAPVGVANGDTVTLDASNASGSFATADIGTGITVTVSVTGLSISGADAGNYTLTPPTTTADITNAPPTATNASYYTWFNQAFSEPASSGLVSYANDPDGDTLNVAAINGVALVNGSVTIVTSQGSILTVYADGSFSYTPWTTEPNNFVDDTFTFTITDGLATANASLNITTNI
jgi:hypothetical protein